MGEHEVHCVACASVSDDVKDPGEQSTQPDVLVLRWVPGGQVTQAPVAASNCEPTGHGTQAAADVEAGGLVPLADALLYMPVGHAKQAPMAANGVYEPGAQFVHALAAGWLNVPAAHDEHTLAFASTNHTTTVS
ncbi:hypothetical protein DYB30_006561 [Aphanomyces astaci]|uniref:Uncharacterized protein n=1 Tax=Aphanomyces astaci TaxID=112090 RepID=A0A397DNR5_APHAT|nr:hypothetical protein DYB38_007433 [Aphanomyces astaci]RHY79225.1 hypothetical protein DYB30_006561 [Aphanomyces astaci]RHY86421.1 hypothetical protein DYB26_008269 [Aphanomyces astaci]